MFPFPSPVLLRCSINDGKLIKHLGRCFRVFCEAFLRSQEEILCTSKARAPCRAGTASLLCNSAQIPVLIFTAMDYLVSLAASEAG